MNTTLNVSGTSQFDNKITCISSLSVSGTSQFNNNITMLSALNVSGATNIGPLYINNVICTQNTFLNIGLNSCGDAYYRVTSHFW